MSVHRWLRKILERWVLPIIESKVERERHLGRRESERGRLDASLKMEARMEKAVTTVKNRNSSGKSNYILYNGRLNVKLKKGAKQGCMYHRPYSICIANTFSAACVGEPIGKEDSYRWC